MQGPFLVCWRVALGFWRGGGGGFFDADGVGLFDGGGVVVAQR